MGKGSPKAKETQLLRGGGEGGQAGSIDAPPQTRSGSGGGTRHGTRGVAHVTPSRSR